MTIKRVYKNTMPGTQYLFRNGKSAQFTNGRYETDVAAEITELDEEIKNGIPHIYVDPLDSTIDTGLQDHIRDAQVRATVQAVKEYEEAQRNGLVSNGTVASGVVGDNFAKNPDGTLVKPGASEAQLVQTTRSDVPVPAIGAAKEIKLDDNTAVIVPVKTELNVTERLKAAAAAGVKTNTGVASSANAGDAAQSSAS